MNNKSTPHTLQVAGIRPTSLFDGEGVNMTIFLQGCSHEPKCEGCQNPSTHSKTGGKKMTVTQVFEEAMKSKLIKGITFSGGEPLDQYEAVVELTRRIHLAGLQVTLYTGYVINCPECCYDLSMFNFVVDGRYDCKQKDYSNAMLGSKNQRFLKREYNSPGLFTDIHTGSLVRQYINAAEKKQSLK